MQSRSYDHLVRLATVGLLLNATVVAWNGQNYLASALLLAIAIPVASLYVLRVWLSETRRARRASRYLGRMELRLRQKLGENTLQWEQTIRKEKGRKGGLFFDHYPTTVNIFVGAALAAGSLGLHSLWQQLANLFGLHSLLFALELRPFEISKTIYSEVWILIIVLLVIRGLVLHWRDRHQEANELIADFDSLDCIDG